MGNGICMVVGGWIFTLVVVEPIILGLLENSRSARKVQN